MFRTEFRAEQKITLFCDNNKKKGQFSDLPYCTWLLVYDYLLYTTYVT